MKFTVEKNLVLKNKAGKKFLADMYVPELPGKLLPLIIFAHGYKGFKDWGAWNLMAEKFAKAGFIFVTFNFSMNGVGIEHASEFTEMDSFSENNYSQELEDLDVVITHFSGIKNVDVSKISLLGHSRGGGISILKAAEDSRISSLITMGSVDSLDRFVTGEKLEHWKQNGIYETYNSRTKQQMPHKIQFLNDYLENKGRLNVQKAAQSLKIPTLIIHGSQDESVNLSAGENLNAWIANSELLIVDKTGHTFNAKEPWTDFKVPVPLNFAIKSAIQFLQK